jgi:hypothetical protein
MRLLIMVTAHGFYPIEAALEISIDQQARDSREGSGISNTGGNDE